MLRVVEGMVLEGMTLLMVTHEMSIAREFSDRVVFMHKGRVHEVGPPAAIFGNPQTPKLKQFLSSLHDRTLAVSAAHSALDESTRL